ncbi:hypothetical protein D3C72_2318690 [compost metagenome]
MLEVSAGLRHDEAILLVGHRVVVANLMRHYGSKMYLNPLDSVECEQPKALIEEIEVEDIAKGSARCEVVSSQRFACCPGHLCTQLI